MANSFFYLEGDDRRKVKLVDNGDGTYSIDTNAVIQTGDIEIGTTEHKDATTDNRSRVLNAEEGIASTEYAGLVRVVGLHALEGSLTETAPATDIASAGLNGRLQRVAQRLSSLIALLPAALGVGGGLKVDGSGTALPASIAD